LNWINNNGVALLYDICGKELADFIMSQIWLGLYAEGILEITKIFIYLFVLVLLIQGGRSVIGYIKSKTINTIKSNFSKKIEPSSSVPFVFISIPPSRQPNPHQKGI